MTYFPIIIENNLDSYCVWKAKGPSFLTRSLQLDEGLVFIPATRKTYSTPRINPLTLYL